MNKIQELIEKVAKDGTITPEAVELLCTMTTGEQEIVFMKNPRLTSGVILYLWRERTGPVEEPTTLPEDVEIPPSDEEVVTVVVDEMPAKPQRKRS